MKLFKCILAILSILTTSVNVQSQTIVYHENFSVADSVVSSGTPGWALSTRLYNSSAKSDSSRVATSGTSVLTTISINTTGYSYVMLNFAHICKIEYADSALIEVSNDNGVTWNRLKQANYLSAGNFGSLGDHFASTSYPTLWVASNNATTPQNTWWKNESFDISAYASNSAQVQVRFLLKDGNANGHFTNYGWMLDDIVVSGSISELTPPSITLVPVIVQDTICDAGTITIKADITDASGIDTAYIVYNINGGPNQYAGMTLLSGNTYSANIVASSYNTHFDYYIRAIDNSGSSNGANSVAQWFYTKLCPQVVQVGSGSTASAMLPCYGYSSFSCGKQLYLETEINTSGVIDSIFFYVANSVGSFNMMNQRVFMKNVSNSVFSDATMPDTTTMTRVFNGSVNWSGPGWKKIPCTNNFIYNGSDNLLIYWINLDGSWSAGYPVFMYTSTTDYKGGYSYDDYVFPPASGSLTYDRPDIKIAFKPKAIRNDDAGVKQIISPSGAALSAVPQNVDVTIKNFGVDTLEKVNINWQIDGVPQTSYNWTGSLLQGIISPAITIASPTFAPGSHIIKVWTSSPNDSIDLVNYNDTSYVSFFACSGILNGTYTIGGIFADYATINDAINAINICGISGPVTFNINTGSYNEKFIINDIPGTSSVNSITFQSLTGNQNDVVIFDSSTSANNNYILKLNGSKYINWKNVTLQNKGVSFGRVVEFAGSIKNILLEGNKLVGSATTNTSDAVAILNDKSTDSVITIRNNTFLNGSYAICNSIGLGSVSMTIEGNTITNPYFCGLYINGREDTKIIGNIITSTSTYSDFFDEFNGICMVNTSDTMQILKNKVSCVVGKAINIEYCTGTNSLHRQVSNNFVSLSGDGSSPAYGIINYYSDSVNYYYNSVNITSAATAAYGMLIEAGTVRLQNNNLVNNGGGPVIYCAVNTLLLSSNYNNMYTSGTDLGYCGSSCTTLANWQVASGNDANSVSVNSLFLSSTDLHVTDDLLNGIGSPVSGITTDIDNETRNTSTPDIGADEFSPVLWDARVAALVNPSTGCGLGSEHVQLRIINNGINTITTFDASFIPDVGQAVVTETVNETILPTDTLIYTFIATIDFGTTIDSTASIIAWVTLAGDVSNMNDTVKAEVESFHLPVNPVVVSPISVPYATAATISAVSSGTLFWYNSPTSNVYISQGSSYVTPVLYSNPTTYYVENRESGSILADIGTGTSYNSNFSYPSPYGTFSKSSREQYLIKASELNAAGISAGPISSLAFYVEDNSNIDILTNYTIAIGHTSLTSLNNWVSAGFTNVYSNSGYAVTIGWNTHTFSTPFVWDGVSNIVVEDCFENNTATLTNNALVRYTPTSFNSVLNYNTGTGSACGSSQVSGVYTNRPNIRLNGMSSPCASQRIPLVINLTGVPANDASVTSMITPNTGILLSANEPVCIMIHNYGTANISNFPVSYQVGSTSTITETVTSTINSGDSLTYTFTSGANLANSGATYSLRAWVSLTGDNIHQNDTVIKTVTNIASVYCAIGCLYGDEGADIGNVTLSTLNNGVALPVTNNWTAVHAYTDYASLTATPLVKGNTYSANVGIITASNTFDTTTVKIFIDYNRNGVFDLPGELAFGSWASASNNIVSGNISIPSTASSGQTRMRIVAVNTSDTNIVQPCVTFYSGEAEDYTVIILPQISNDGGVIQFTQPSDTTTTSGVAVPVEVVIKNFGTQPMTSCNIKYNVNGGAVVSQSWSGNLAAGASATVALSSYSALDGYNQIKAYIELTGDIHKQNDTLVITVFGFPTENISWTDNYDGNNNWYAAGNVWERGLPNSSVINYAHTAPNAWKTIVAGYYPNNQDACLYSPFFNFQNVDNAVLSFYQWYNIQVNNDAGRIEYSTNGTTWVALGSVGDPLGTNWYNTNYAGFTGWSGNNGGWVQSSYVLTAFNNYPTPVQFRYHFKSDASGFQDGWAVDDFAITVPSIAKDAGVNEIITPGTGSVLTGTSTPVKVVVENFGLDTLHSLTVAYKVENNAPTTQAWSGTLAPGDTMLFSFTQPYISLDHNYRLCSYTILSGDTYHSNDTTCKNIIFSPIPDDAGIYAIVEPGTQSYINYPNYVVVTLKNFGTNTISSMNVSYKVGSNATVTEAWSGSLAGGASVPFTFATTFMSPINMYTLTVYTDLGADGYRYNDTLRKSVQGIVGIEENAGSIFGLYQNIPNPARNTTVIPFSLPENGNAAIEIRNVLGQLMFSQQRQENSGKHTLEIDVNEWPSGIYFYSLVFDNMKIVKKMTISR
ncbi:MAG: GEVED domain-containing protein [Bacteroidota bacterium]